MVRTICGVCDKVVVNEGIKLNVNGLYCCHECVRIQEEDSCDWITTGAGAKI